MNDRRRFTQWLRKHKLGGISLGILILLGLSAIFADFLSPYHPGVRNRVTLQTQPVDDFFPWPSQSQQEPKQELKYAKYAPPIRIHIFDKTRRLSWPYVCGLVMVKEKPSPSYQEDCSQKYPIGLFVRGYEYRLFGLFKTNVHLFGAIDPQTLLLFGKVNPKAPLFLLGTDGYGQDMFSRILSAGRISLGISFAAVLLSLLIALPLGGFSGYFGGAVDTFIQRIVEGVLSFPRLALLLVLASSIMELSWRLWGLVFLLGLIGWAPLARILRGQVLALRKADYIEAAHALGAGHLRILVRHVIPQTMSTVVVSTALAIPNILVLESFLSYLGSGVPSMIPSWGLLLKEAKEVQQLLYHPWILFPAGAIILTVLACTFLGDALRDWFDPFSQKRRI